MIPEALIIRPKSGISKVEDIIDLIDQALEESSAINLYGVGAKGSITQFFITKFDKINKDSEASLTYLETSILLEGEIKPYTIILENHGISCFDNYILSEYMLFSNFIAAEKYSKYLKTNKEYLNYVRAWETYTNELMRRINE